MTQKNKKSFNPKIYSGKPRIYAAIPNETRISRLWIWDEEAKEYRAPQKGKAFLTNRYETAENGKQQRVYHFFEEIEKARDWQREGDNVTPVPTTVSVPDQISGPTFGEVIAEWKRRCFPRIAESTRISYENIVRLYFGNLIDLSIYQLTPQRIDCWLDGLKDPDSWTMKSRKRKAFKNELKLLSTILNYYNDYHDDAKFQNPLKPRHRQAIQLNRRTAKSKDLDEVSFLLFRDALRTLYGKGELMAALATVQYYQALRISEAAALHWEDVELNRKNPSESRIRIRRMVVWPRKRELVSFIQEWFKNAKSSDGIKEQPMFPETFPILSKLHYPGAKGLIFQSEGTHLEYRTIQSAYDRTFRKVGLPYSGTHVMRHGGCRRVYNQEGDLAVAQQLLGNSDLKSTLVYAKRSASALTEVATKYWKKGEENACTTLHN